MNFAFRFERSKSMCGGWGGVGCLNDFMFKKKENHNNKIEEGTLNMNFAFDLRGVGVGWEGKVVE
jgi:hypothetical protein